MLRSRTTCLRNVYEIWDAFYLWTAVLMQLSRPDHSTWSIPCPGSQAPQQVLRGNLDHCLPYSVHFCGYVSLVRRPTQNPTRLTPSPSSDKSSQVQWFGPAHPEPQLWQILVCTVAGWGDSMNPYWGVPQTQLSCALTGQQPGLALSSGHLSE